MKNEPERVAGRGDFPRVACNCFKLRPHGTKPGGLAQEVGQEMVWFKPVRKHCGLSRNDIAVFHDISTIIKIGIVAFTLGLWTDNRQMQEFFLIETVWVSFVFSAQFESRSLFPELPEVWFLSGRSI